MGRIWNWVKKKLGKEEETVPVLSTYQRQIQERTQRVNEQRRRRGQEPLANPLQNQQRAAHDKSSTDKIRHQGLEALAGIKRYRKMYEANNTPAKFIILRTGLVSKLIPTIDLFFSMLDDYYKFLGSEREKYAFRQVLGKPFYFRTILAQRKSAIGNSRSYEDFVKLTNPFLPGAEEWVRKMTRNLDKAVTAVHVVQQTRLAA